MPFITARVVSVVRADAIAALAFAGNDQSVLCATLVQLEASIIGDDIENHTFEWEQTFGTPVTLINPNTLTPSFVNPQVSDLEFTFYLDRNTPFEDSDVVIVSRAPQDQVTVWGGATGMIGQSGGALTGTPVSSKDLIVTDAHVTGWAFTNPPTARYSPIFEASDLNRVRENLNSSYWLMRDIDLSEYSNWTPIGTAARPFTGELQGNGFVVDNLTITSATKDAGLFSRIGNGALIEDVGVINANISGVGSGVYKAILAGSTTGIVTVRDCHSEGTVASGGDLAGGLIGDTGSDAGSTYENTYADVTVTGGGGNTGGWAGTFQAGPTYLENYGNTTKTASIVGTGSPGATEVSGLTTAQLTAETNFTGWDFTDTWEIDEGVSPATLQQDNSYIRAIGECDDNWMIAWGTPDVTTLQIRAPLYKHEGTIIEEVTSGGWGFPRFIPKNRHGGLMTPDTTHRITTVWTVIQDGTKVRLDTSSASREIRIVSDEKFTSKNTSRNYGPYGNDNVTGAWGSGAIGMTKNLVITISNPSKITMSANELATFSIGGSIGATTNLAISRFDGAQMLPITEDTSTFSIGGSIGINLNLVIVRLNGASLG